MWNYVISEIADSIEDNRISIFHVSTGQSFNIIWWSKDRIWGIDSVMTIFCDLELDWSCPNVISSIGAWRRRKRSKLIWDQKIIDFDFFPLCKIFLAPGVVLIVHGQNHLGVWVGNYGGVNAQSIITLTTWGLKTWYRCVTWKITKSLVNDSRWP